MRHQRYFAFIIFILIAALVPGFISGCASTQEKQLKTKGFVLSYKDKVDAGAAINRMHLNHPIKLSEKDIRYQLKALVYEELSLFGKKKSVFLPRDIDQIGRLLSKAIQRVPSHKIIYYELETSKGTTSGNVFASKDHIHWRFDSIKGLGFSRRSYNGGWNTNWRMVLQSGQKYKAVSKILGDQAQENWIFSKLQPSSFSKKNIRPESQKSNHSRRKAKTQRSSNNRETTPAKSVGPALEEKLEFLRSLHEKNLIDDNEYDQKRKDLLDTYL